MASHKRISRADAVAGVLPLDALSEILLRLSAKELCRLRAVCRPWRSLLSDPLFIAAHAARHPGPLITVGYYTDQGFICDIMDLSGRVIKRTTGAKDERAKSIHHDLILTSTGKNRYHLRNLATGAVHVLPADQHSTLQPCVPFHMHFVQLGHVPSTGEYKVIRVIDTCSFKERQQWCDVFTHDGSNRAQGWRETKAPPKIVKLVSFVRTAVVKDGIVYFLTDEPGLILPFDLETEDWKQPLRGPLCSHDPANWHKISVATLKGCLVVVHSTSRSSMDLWFLMDYEKGLWVKSTSLDGLPMQMKVHPYRHALQAHPLLVFDDGKIVFIYINGTLIRTYDPRASTYTVMADMGVCFEVGLFTGSLLRLATDTS